MSYRHHTVKKPHKSISLTRRTAPKFDKMKEHIKRDMYNAKYAQLNQELQKINKKYRSKTTSFFRYINYFIAFKKIC